MTAKQPPRMAAHPSRRICTARTGSYRSKKPRMKTVVASGDRRVKAVQMAGRGRPRGHQVRVPGTARLRDRVSRPHDPADCQMPLHFLPRPA